MLFERPDLDGKSLITPGRPDTWIVFHGKRHRIPSTMVFDALFSNIEHLASIEEVDEIALGPDLSEGACLIRETGTLAIYLLTGLPEGGVSRHFVPTYESLVDFSFDESKVVMLPKLVMDALPLGRELTSAGDRAMRRL